MFDGMVQVLTRPVAFFNALQGNDKLASRAVWVVLLISLMGGVIGYFSALPTAEAFQGSALGSIGLMTAPLFSAVVTFLSWLVYGLIVRMTAGLEVKPWAVVGYSMAPQLILYTLLIVIAALFPVEISILSVDFSNPETIQEASKTVQQEIQRSVYGRSSQIIGYAASLWWIVLIFLGVRAGSTTGKAISSALIAGLLSLGLILLPFLLAPVA